MVDKREHGLRYVHRGKIYPSVTTILGCEPQLWMRGYATRETALWAVASREHWLPLVDTDPAAAVQLIKHGPERHRGKAADLGTAIHLYAEKWGAGEELPVVDETLRAQCREFVRFVDDYEPVPVMTERKVFNTRVGYAGTFDALVSCPKLSDFSEKCGWGAHGPNVLMDYKSGSRVHATAALQLRAYAEGEFVQGEDGHTEEPMFARPDAYYVVHLRPRSYTLFRVLGEHPDAWRTFRALAAVRHYAENVEHLLVPGT